MVSCGRGDLKSYSAYEADQNLELFKVATKVGLDQLDRGEGQLFDPVGHKQRLYERLEQAPIS